MDKFNADGIVIRVQATGETTRIITVLTAEHGVLRAFAKGARGAKSKLQSATSLFAFCRFSFVRSKESFIVREADIKEIFFDLRNSLEALALAQYFCDAAARTIPEDGTGEEFLRLLLNSLHFLCKNSKDKRQLKAIFELRLAVLSGYCPNIVACAHCAAFESEIMYFDPLRGTLTCNNCAQSEGIALPLSVVSAMRHIVFAPFDRLFSFSLAAPLLQVLEECAEHYFLAVTQQKFKTLEYYRSVCTLQSVPYD